MPIASDPIPARPPGAAISASVLKASPQPVLSWVIPDVDVVRDQVSCLTHLRPSQRLWSGRARDATPLIKRTEYALLTLRRSRNQLEWLLAPNPAECWQLTVDRDVILSGAPIAPGGEERPHGHSAGRWCDAAVR